MVSTITLVFTLTDAHYARLHALPKMCVSHFVLAKGQCNCRRFCASVEISTGIYTLNLLTLQTLIPVASQD
ncbi:MAG: hypothetical protein JWQ49_4215 [Edaphobacter sp.]|nr:hypothetical protein [Edaphobacter sp.]